MKNAKNTLKNKLTTYWNMTKFIALGYGALVIGEKAYLTAWPVQVAIAIAALIVAYVAIKEFEKK